MCLYVCVSACVCMNVKLHVCIFVCICMRVNDGDREKDDIEDARKRDGKGELSKHPNYYHII